MPPRMVTQNRGKVFLTSLYLTHIFVDISQEGGEKVRKEDAFFLVFRISTYPKLWRAAFTTAVGVERKKERKKRKKKRFRK